MAHGAQARFQQGDAGGDTPLHYAALTCGMPSGGFSSTLAAMLASAGARLLRPKLMAGFTQWQQDWHAAQAAEEAKGRALRQKQQAAAHLSEMDALQQQLAATRSEVDAARTDEQRRAAAAAEKEEAEREARVAHFQQVSLIQIARHLVPPVLARELHIVGGPIEELSKAPLPPRGGGAPRSHTVRPLSAL